MFWQYEINVSTFDQLFEHDDLPTLEMLLNDNDFLQELKSHNTKLLNFLSHEERVSEIVDHLVKEPSAEIEEKIRFKYPMICTEILISGMSNIDLIVFEEFKYLSIIWGVIKSKEVPNPLIIGFVVKVLVNYLSFHLDSMINFFKEVEPEFVTHLLQHISFSPVSQLMTYMLSIVNRSHTAFIHDMFKKVNVAAELIDSFKNSSTDEKAYAASSMIIELIRSYRTSIELTSDQFEYSFVKNLYSDESLDIIIQNMFEVQDREVIFSSAASVLAALFNLQRIGHLNGEDFYLPQNVPFKFVSEGKIEFQKFAHNLEKLISLFNKNSKETWPNPSEGKWLKLGRNRLLLLEIIVSLMLYRDKHLESEFIRLNIFQFFLNLFEKYPHNNFLHSLLELAFTCVLEGTGWASINSSCQGIFSVTSDLIQNLLDQSDFIAKLFTWLKSKTCYSAHIKDLTRILLQCSKDGVHKNIINAKFEALSPELKESLSETIKLISSIDEIEIVDKRFDTTSQMDHIDDELGTPVFMPIDKGLAQIKAARAAFVYEDDIDSIENAFDVDIDTGLQTDDFNHMSLTAPPVNYSTEVYDNLNALAEETIDSSSDAEYHSSSSSSDEENDSNASVVEIKKISQDSIPAINIPDISIPDINLPAEENPSTEVRSSSLTSKDGLSLPMERKPRLSGSEHPPSNTLGVNSIQFTRGGTSSPVPESFNFSIENNDPFESDDSPSPIECHGL